MAADEGFVLSSDAARQFGETVRKVRGLTPGPLSAGKQVNRDLPPLIACCLLQNLYTGAQAKAVVLRREPSNVVQIVSLVGEPDFENPDLGFLIYFDPEDDGTGGVSESSPNLSDPIPLTATAAEFKQALLKIPHFTANDIEVHMGDPQLGRWLVEFKGRWANKDVPLLRAVITSETSPGRNTEAQVTGVTLFEDSGYEPITIYSVVPAGPPTGPTPARMGAMIIAGWIHEVGYGPLVVEPRDYFLNGTFY